MTWESETNDIITLISPELNFFTALWIENERSGEKKLGVFDPPKFKGSIIQDLGVKSTSYPLTIYFDGPFHYKDCEKFWKSLSEEEGQWEVIHPTKGSLILQLVTYREIIAPTTSGNVTAFETTWLEPANIERLITTPEIGALVLLEILTGIQDAIVQINQLKSDLYSAVQSAINVINQAAGFVDSVLAELAALDALVNDSWNEAKAALSNYVSQFQSDPSDPDIQADLSAALVDVISIPLESVDSYDTRISLYEEYAENLYTLAPTSDTPEDFNRALFLELSLISTLISYSRIIVTSSFATRAEVIAAMDNVTAMYNTIFNLLDSIQENFEDIDIDEQYFSNSQAYTSMQNIFALTMQYLISQFFNLKTEKRFTIKKARSPLEITVTEYGSLGENDSNYDLFLTSNNLIGDNILLLPAGTEVVIYA